MKNYIKDIEAIIDYCKKKVNKDPLNIYNLLTTIVQQYLMIDKTNQIKPSNILEVGCGMLVLKKNEN